MRSAPFRNYTIKAYYPPNQGGGMAIETWHSTEGSRDIELSAFYERMKRGEIDRLILITHCEPYGQEELRLKDMHRRFKRHG